MDPIANMLTTIRNSSLARKQSVRVPYSSLKHRIAGLLRDHGYVGPVAVAEDGTKKYVDITLLYNGEQPVLRGVERVSKPSRRWYVRRDEIPRVLSGFGIAVLSTSQGLLTDKQARTLGVGGEVICRVW